MFNYYKKKYSLVLSLKPKESKLFLNICFKLKLEGGIFMKGVLDDLLLKIFILRISIEDKKIDYCI